jgi:5,6-dimethylbenzimidazole synthase
MTTGRFDDGFRASLHDLLVWRRDVRRFRRDPLPEGALERLVSLACLAPSVGLSQPWRFLSVESKARREAIRANFERSNAEALRTQTGDKAAA